MPAENPKDCKTGKGKQGKPCDDCESECKYFETLLEETDLEIKLPTDGKEKPASKRNTASPYLLFIKGK